MQAGLALQQAKKWKANHNFRPTAAEAKCFSWLEARPQQLRRLYKSYNYRSLYTARHPHSGMNTQMSIPLQGREHKMC